MDEEITGDSERRKKGRAVGRRDKRNKGKKEVRRISKREEQKKKEKKEDVLDAQNNTLRRQVRSKHSYAPVQSPTTYLQN